MKAQDDAAVFAGGQPAEDNDQQVVAAHSQEFSISAPIIYYFELSHGCKPATSSLYMIISPNSPVLSSSLQVCTSQRQFKHKLESCISSVNQILRQRSPEVLPLRLLSLQPLDQSCSIVTGLPNQNSLSAVIIRTKTNTSRFQYCYYILSSVRQCCESGCEIWLGRARWNVGLPDECAFDEALQ